MPYSALYKQQLKELVDEELSKIKFKQPSDFADFVEVTAVLIPSKEEKSISTAYQEEVADLQETLIDYGFDYYATEAVLEKPLCSADYKSRACFRSIKNFNRQRSATATNN